MPSPFDCPQCGSPNLYGSRRCSCGYEFWPASPKIGIGLIVILVVVMVAGSIGAAAMKGAPPEVKVSLIGGGIAGAVCGLVPFFVGWRRKRKLAHIALWTSVVSGVAMGALLALPVAGAFTFAIFRMRRDPYPLSTAKAVEPSPCDVGEAKDETTGSAQHPLVSTGQETSHQRLAHLKKLFDAKLITREEYDQKRKTILDSL